MNENRDGRPMDPEAQRKYDEAQEFLAKVRKTIADAESVVTQAELRIKETDRFLEAQGLTREQVMSFKFTKEQRLAANEELRRLGLPPIEEDEAAFDFDAATAEMRASQIEVAPDAAATGGDMLEERRRKFGNFMQEYRL